MDRVFFRWLCAIAGLVLAGIWLIMTVTGGPVLDWIPPASVLALGVAVALLIP